MGRQLTKSVKVKLRTGFAVLRGEVAVAEAARPEETSANFVSNRRDQFLTGRQWPSRLAFVAGTRSPAATGRRNRAVTRGDGWDTHGTVV